MARRKSKPKPLTFEQHLARAEQAVERLESGELPLEKALEEYEIGVRNLKSCAKLIQDAHQRVEQLLEGEGDGEARLAPFEAPGEGDHAQEPGDEPDTTSDEPE